MSQKSFGNNIFKEYIPKLGLWSKTMRTVLYAINIEFCVWMKLYLYGP